MQVHTFLSDEYYQQVRTLICHERVLLANAYLRFDGSDCRFLLTGAAQAVWNEQEQQLLPEVPLFYDLLKEFGALREVPISNPDTLPDFLATLEPDGELCFLQQGDQIGGDHVLTEVCLYPSSPGGLLLSELRQGREGFDFPVDHEELIRRFRLAERKSGYLLNRKALVSSIKTLDQRKAFLLGRHNQSLRFDDSKMETLLRELISERSKEVGSLMGKGDQLPTYFALKYCGPICWYFNRIVQSVLGLHSAFSCFTADQLELIKRVDQQSQVCRNLGLIVGRKENSEKELGRLTKALDRLILQTRELQKLELPKQS
jgi:hypothetical protein